MSDGPLETLSAAMSFPLSCEYLFDRWWASSPPGSVVEGVGGDRKSASGMSISSDSVERSLVLWPAGVVTGLAYRGTCGGGISLMLEVPVPLTREKRYPDSAELGALEDGCACGTLFANCIRGAPELKAARYAGSELLFDVDGELLIWEDAALVGISSGFPGAFALPQ